MAAFGRLAALGRLVPAAHSLVIAVAVAVEDENHEPDAQPGGTDDAEHQRDVAMHGQLRRAQRLPRIDADGDERQREDDGGDGESDAAAATAAAPGWRRVTHDRSTSICAIGNPLAPPFRCRTTRRGR